MKAKCNKNLYMRDGVKCFTKGKVYTVDYFTDEKMTLMDDQKCTHSIWNVSSVDGWYEHFTIITEISTPAIL